VSWVLSFLPSWVSWTRVGRSKDVEGRWEGLGLRDRGGGGGALACGQQEVERQSVRLGKRISNKRRLRVQRRKRRHDEETDTRKNGLRTTSPSHTMFLTKTTRYGVQRLLTRPLSQHPQPRPRRPHRGHRRSQGPAGQEAGVTNHPSARLRRGKGRVLQGASCA